MQESRRFCVYLHRRKDSGEIFYVGEGTARRPTACYKNTRSKRWRQVVEESGGFIVEIIKDNLTKEEARNLEDYYIELYRDLVINSTFNTKPTDLLLEDIQDWFEISEFSQSGLVWKSVNNTVIQAGTIRSTNGKKYWKVNLRGRDIRVHRIVALLSGMYLTKDLVVDHINGNGLDNRICNLRVCTQLQNMENLKYNVTLSGYSGVVGVKFSSNNQAWTANITVDGKTYTKTYSASKYGLDPARELAIAARKEFEERYFKELLP